MLSSKHLAFLEVAHHKSFTKASESLYISQPAISKSIQSLENEYKVKLFDRYAHKIQLTPVGSLLYEKLLQVKNIQDQTSFEISLLRETLQSKGVLKLGASTTVALYILPKVLSSFNKQYPHVELNLLNRNSYNVLESLIAHEINFAIIEGPPKNKKVNYYPFLTDSVVAVCSGRSFLAKKKLYQIKELPSLPIVLREKGSGTLAALVEALKKNHLKQSDLNVKVRLGGTEALKNFLLESDCLGFLPKISILKELQNKELIEVSIEKLSVYRKFYFVERKGESVSELNKTFLNFTKRIYNL